LRDMLRSLAGGKDQVSSKRSQDYMSVKINCIDKIRYKRVMSNTEVEGCSTINWYKHLFLYAIIEDVFNIKWSEKPVYEPR